MPKLTNDVVINTYAFIQVANFFINNRHKSAFKNFISKIQQIIKLKLS